MSRRAGQPQQPPPAAAAPAGRGGGGRAACAGPAAERDRGEQLDGVGVAGGAGCRVAGGGHRPVDLEGRRALAAAEVVARHGRRIPPPAPLRPATSRAAGTQVGASRGSRDGRSAARAATTRGRRTPQVRPAATGPAGRRGAGGAASPSAAVTVRRRAPGGWSRDAVGAGAVHRRRVRAARGQRARRPRRPRAAAAATRRPAGPASARRGRASRPVPIGRPREVPPRDVAVAVEAVAVQRHRRAADLGEPRDERRQALGLAPPDQSTHEVGSSRQ